MPVIHAPGPGNLMFGTPEIGAPGSGASIIDDLHVVINEATLGCSEKLDKMSHKVLYAPDSMALGIAKALRL